MSYVHTPDVRPHRRRRIGPSWEGTVIDYNTYGLTIGAGTSTDTRMRDRENVVGVEPAEYTKSTDHRGRYRRKTLRRLYKLISLAEQKIYLRWNGISQFNTQGTYGMFNHTNTTSTVYSVPMFMFDLTSFGNQSAGSFLPAAPMVSFSQNGTTGTWSYSNVFAKSGSDGVTTTNQWQVENAPTTAANTAIAPYRSSNHMWCDIRMLLYGCTTLPTKYDISIISFPENEWDPFFLQNQGANQLDADVNPGATQLLEYMLHPYVFTPLAIEDPNMKKRFHIHYTKRLTIQPNFTNETDTAVPHMHEFKLFHKFDAVRKYDWVDNAQVGNTQTGTNMKGAAFQVQTNAVSPYIDYNRRRWLCIRAITGPSSSNAAPQYSATINPSFDLLVRTCHKINV